MFFWQTVYTHVYTIIYPNTTVSLVVLLHPPQLTLSSLKLPLSDVPAESQPSTSPFISSLSLSSSEENIGKRLLRKLSEWAICHEWHPHIPSDVSKLLSSAEYLSNRWCVMPLAATYSFLESRSSSCSCPFWLRYWWLILFYLIIWGISCAIKAARSKANVTIVAVTVSGRYFTQWWLAWIF